LADKRRVPEAQAATMEEVERAILALTPDELRHLHRYAAYRAELIGRAAKVHEGPDVLQHATMLTLQGKRNWHKSKVDLKGHLLGVIWSVTGHWAKEHPDLADPEADLIKNTEAGETPSPLDLAASGKPGAQRTLEAKKQVEAIERYFADDPIIPLIIDGLREEMTYREIADALGVDQKIVDAGVKKMHRHLPSVPIEGNFNV